MEKGIVTSFLVWLALVGAPAAADPSRIELRDGSVISGEVVGFSGGHYLVRSPALGEISVDQSEIRAVRPEGGPSAGSGAESGSGYGSEIQSLQQQMVANPEIVKLLNALANDPEVRAALADPELMRLVTSGNLAALQHNPRFQSLMNHPEIQAIMGQVTGH
jgi:hypothetical protein